MRKALLVSGFFFCLCALHAGSDVQPTARCESLCDVYDDRRLPDVFESTEPQILLRIDANDLAFDAKKYRDGPDCLWGYTNEGDNYRADVSYEYGGQEYEFTIMLHPYKGNVWETFMSDYTYDFEKEATKQGVRARIAPCLVMITGQDSDRKIFVTSDFFPDYLGRQTSFNMRRFQYACSRGKLDRIEEGYWKIRGNDFEWWYLKGSNWRCKQSGRWISAGGRSGSVEVEKYWKPAFPGVECVVAKVENIDYRKGESHIYISSITVDLRIGYSSESVSNLTVRTQGGDLLMGQEEAEPIQATKSPVETEHARRRSPAELAGEHIKTVTFKMGAGKRHIIMKDAEGNDHGYYGIVRTDRSTGSYLTINPNIGGWKSGIEFYPPNHPYVKRNRFTKRVKARGLTERDMIIHKGAEFEWENEKDGKRRVKIRVEDYTLSDNKKKILEVTVSLSVR